MLLRSASAVAYTFASAWLVVPPRTVDAQQASASPAAWLTYSGDHAVSDRHALLLDAQARLQDGAALPRQLLLHAGLAWSLGSGVRVASGYGYRGTRSWDGADTTYLPEHRLWQAIHLTTRIGHATLAHRMRLEERRMQLNDASTPGSESASRWVTAYRLRYQFRGTLPFSRTTAEARVYGTASNEVFAVGGGPDPGFALDQNRAALGIGVRATPALRVEAGYLNQSTITPGLRFAVRTHALQVTVLSTTGPPHLDRAPRR